MPRLVLLSEGFTGRAFELKAERTTIGRHEDNSFQIPASSVSGHHAEILLQGNDILIKDLGSTNGTYLNGTQITESVVQPWQTVRFGTIEARVELSPTPPGPPAKKVQDKTTVVPHGVKLNELEQGTQKVTFDKKSPFQKKKNTARNIFIVISIILGLGIVGLLLMLFK
ncbi:MAG: FHA domain-containing protein [Verrucomicrobia bacterium]|nr:FHA domain-containing protein [Verrucomicrobiota bacterium]